MRYNVQSDLASAYFHRTSSNGLDRLTTLNLNEKHSDTGYEKLKANESEEMWFHTQL
jgi:hypothetical protein